MDNTLGRKDNVDIDTRVWDNDLFKWNEGSGPRPGPHPDPNHLWNTNPDYF